MNQKIKLLFIISLLFCIYTTYANANDDINPLYEKLDPQHFVEVTAKIDPCDVKNEQTGKLTYGYRLIYNVTESTAYIDNQKIEGEIIKLYFFNDYTSRAKAQEIKIKYEKADPSENHYKKLIELEKN